MASPRLCCEEVDEDNREEACTLAAVDDTTRADRTEAALEEGACRESILGRGCAQLSVKMPTTIAEMLARC